MAARSSSKQKQPASRLEPVSENSGVRTRSRASVAPAPAKKAASATNKAPAKTPRKGAKTTEVKASKRRASPSAQNTIEFLQEQNEALLAELEQAQARIAYLEEVNRNVANRIDWVIDSLQSVVSAKR